MTEQNPDQADRPGHLDIDAVSAFVDRDLGLDDLATVEIHLRECPACHREVLEIRTTVMLLAGLPQYMPRRSFCLGHEHARAARRRGRIPGARGWTQPGPPAGYPAAAIAVERGRGGGWLPTLQVAAMVIGAMLLLVTSSDLMGMPPQPAQWLAEPEPQVEFLSAPAPEGAAPRTAAPGADTDAALEPAAPESESGSRPGIVADRAQGTAGGDSASQEVLTDEEAPARTAPAFATTAAIAAVTQAVPTAAAAPARQPEPATPSAEAPASPGDQPSRLRLVQIALGLALAWLVVSIVGLRWVRGLR